MPDPAEDGSAGPQRMLVVRVDLDQPLPRLAAGSYPAAWVLAFRGERPVGHAEIPFTAPTIGAEQVLDALGDLPTATVPGDGPLPAVSVVVPTTFERLDSLRRNVCVLLAQDHPDFEVVVVDNRPAARTGLFDDPRVSVVPAARRGISAARNVGVRAARCELIAFTDDDVEVEPGWLRAISRAFAADPETACVTGPVLPKELETPAQIWFERSGSKLAQRYVPVVYGGPKPGSFKAGGTFVYRGTFGMGANFAVRRRVLDALGGFDEALGTGTPAGGGEDLLLFARLVYLGHRIRFDPSVHVFHNHRRTVDELRRQMYAYGTGYTAMLAALVREDPRHLAGLAWYTVEALALAARKFGGGRAGAPGYPKELGRVELRGLLAGPWRYRAGRRLLRRVPGEPVAAPVSPVSA
jgi:GT2 family glycosyltransferase